jgi:hypothetical protein
MGCDKNDNLYVWDDGYQAILKFKSDGTKLWRLKYKKGTGDGEFMTAGLTFAVSGSGKICLGDRMSKTLTVLDSSGHFLNKFLVNMWPASILFGNDESIYVEGFQMSYSGNLIQHYSSTGTLLGSFCERQDSYTVNFSGNSGRLTKDIKGNIYYANFYPYKIDIFNKDGGRIDKIERNLGDSIPPKIDNGNVFSMSGLKGIVIINNNLLGVFVLRDSKTNNWGLDIYDAERHHIKYLASNTFPKQFRYRVSATDSKGNIYFDLNDESNPVIVKYKINMNNLIN